MPQKITITKNSIEITKYENLIFFWDTVVNKMLFSEISVSNPDAGIIWDKLSLVSRGGEVISVSGLKKRDMKKILKIINYTTSH
ncbi:MAG: hypothetical protein GY909_15730 [Oligoflexia bacterium]|nr:hypothetical protein [Oligoflexia bacterium]